MTSLHDHDIRFILVDVSNRIIRKIYLVTGEWSQYTFPIILHVRPAQTKISPCIREVRSEPSQGTVPAANDPKGLSVDIEKSDQPMYAQAVH